jgi:peptide/nickel transport system substrate-binding protein
VTPLWVSTPLAERLPGLRNSADALFPKAEKPAIRVSLPEGPGAELLLRALVRSWGALGFPVERAANDAVADFRLIDEVAPSSSPAWFLREFHCNAAAVCDPEIDDLLAAARQAIAPQQRYALLQQAAAKIDEAQLFIPITAPVRWSLVSRRIQGFAGNRFAIHTLTDLEQRPGTGG